MRKLVIVFFLIFLPINSFAEVRLIELKHRAATDVVDQVRELLDNDEKVQAAGGHLILIADGESLQAVEKLISVLDRPLVNLLVRVRQTAELQRAGKDMSAAVHYGNKSGVTAAGTTSFRRGNTASSLEQSLSLLEGGKGLIEVGQEIPYTEYWSVVTGRYAGYSEQTDYMTIATGFWVSPIQVVGDKVLIEVEPYISSAEQNAENARPTVNYNQLRTRLLVPLAQWYPLGSHLQQRDEISRAIISWRSSNGQADRELQIRIDPKD